jgi:hypothetical protein
MSPGPIESLPLVVGSLVGWLDYEFSLNSSNDFLHFLHEGFRISRFFIRVGKVCPKITLVLKILGRTVPKHE